MRSSSGRAGDGVEVGRSPLDPHLPLGALVAEDRLLVLAAAALAGGAEVLVIDAGDIGPEAERALAGALEPFGDEGATAILVTTAHPPRQLVRSAPSQKVAVS